MISLTWMPRWLYHLLRHLWRQRRRIRRIITLRQLRRGAAFGGLRIMVGAGQVRFPGWVSTDQDTLDLLREDTWASVLRPGCLTAILAEHVWEHLTEEEGRLAARICFCYLGPGGRLRVAVPDGFRPDQAYQEMVAPPADGHKTLYTHISLSAVFSAAGFQVRLLEHYDDSGVFHGDAWSQEGGIVHRSRLVGGPATAGDMVHTSIILDAVKEPGG